MENNISQNKDCSSHFSKFLTSSCAFMKNHNEHIISQAVICVVLMIALALLPYYCKSFMMWMYILVGLFIIVALVYSVLHLRKNTRIRKENEEAMGRNPERIAILCDLGRTYDFKTIGALDYPLLRHPKGYNVEWVYNNEWEVPFFTMYIKEKAKAVVEQKYNDWLLTQTLESMADFEMIYKIASFEDTVDAEFLIGVNALHLGIRAKRAMSLERIESMLIELQTLVDSLTPYFMHRQFRIKGILKNGIYIEYEGLTLVSATTQTSKGMEDAMNQLVSYDFSRLDDMLSSVRCDDMVYIDTISIVDVPLCSLEETTKIVQGECNEACFNC